MKQQGHIKWDNKRCSPKEIDVCRMIHTVAEGLLGCNQSV